jgi:hypothetical protein
MIATNENADIDPWADEAGLTEAQAIWRERERRQRTVRFLMMFLLMLLLMDGEEQTQRRRSRDSLNLRKRNRGQNGEALETSLYGARRGQDKRVEGILQKHPRYQRLVHKNNGKDVDSEVRSWAEQQPELEKDEFAQGVEENQNQNQNNMDPEEEKKVWHYPWNATGFYRGEWVRENNEQEKGESPGSDTDKESASKSGTNGEKEKQPSTTFRNGVELEVAMLNSLEERKESVGVYLLPAGLELKMPNSSLAEPDEARSAARLHRSHQSGLLRGTGSSYGTGVQQEHADNLHVTLTKTSGRAAFQLYARSVPAIKELSILDGFVKLYDSDTVGYSTRRDILLRVSGVLLHSLGKISLVSSSSPGRSALVIKKGGDEERRRRLQESLLSDDLSSLDMEQIRSDALALFQSGETDAEKGPTTEEYETRITSFDLDDKDEDVVFGLAVPEGSSLDAESSRRRLSSALEQGEGQDGVSGPGMSNTTGESSVKVEAPTTGNSSEIGAKQSEIVIPYPFVPDDEDQSITRTRTPAARSMPPREQLLEANAGKCEFEISMNVQEEEWTTGQWRTLLSRHVNELLRLDPALQEKEKVDGTEKAEPSERPKNSGGKPKGVSKVHQIIQDQALVMTMNGTIYSQNCDFTASLNATAIRTNWEHTTGKAINYSFYMMLTCLTQIVLLLRQLLHTQAQSAATRVSLLCIGWQTVLDALLCLIHIYLSLAMQPLFTAFVSVAFFKLLIFCVIEMKYMAIIIQARNASNGGNTLELLRRQIAMLHLRFYVALITSFLISFYAWDSYRTIYMLALYSFWVPQIIQNIVTEAKRPLHPYYVYGMSLSRLVAPLYIFAVQNNFLKEVYPDSPTNVFMCQLLIVWVGIQAAMLEAQGRYGARFMIPARFLPPKFDYSRPLPSSLLPEGIEEIAPSETLKNEREPQTEVRALIPRDTSPHKATGGARNRIKGSRVNRTECSMTTETMNAAPTHPPVPSFDCVICYNEIDVRNRRGYMLAPCDHLFHRDCLVQWMEVKMECPICRTELPAL